MMTTTDSRAGGTASAHRWRGIVPRGGRVVVAMSGGVDSCAAALILAEEGYEVIGVSMQVWDYRKNGGNASRATCCAPSDFDDAREIAESLGFPFYVFDFEDSFYGAVIKPFVDSYLAGKTPNPCLDCNRKVKFAQLRNRARALGADCVATGHYARIRPRSDGALGLYTAADPAKDQSYFLYAMTQFDLERTIFPVAEMTKPEVRAYLEARGYRIAGKAESQDICFVSSSVPEFIERETGKRPSGGDIVSVSGERLGTHDGIHSFTVGQRRGLGISERFPLYVVDIDPEDNRVTVGGREDLEREKFLVEDVSWTVRPPDGSIRSRVKLRYRHAGTLCEVRALEERRAEVTFVDGWTAVSPGQAAVFYAESGEVDGAVELIGGGRIVKEPGVPR